MVKFFILFLLLILNSCSLTNENFYTTENIQKRPADGYPRMSLFSLYINSTQQNFLNSDYFFNTRNRSWDAASDKFRQLYPKFQVELIAFNNIGSRVFSWQERILFADAMDLVVFVVNHPIFEQEMSRVKFYNNEQTKILSPEYVLDHIRSTKLYFYIGKDSLPSNVLAQATLEGHNQTIWFRDDIDYQNEYTVMLLGEILLHELMHNLGYLHSSNVPHGVQQPFLKTIDQIPNQDILKFIQNTPYHEEQFLRRVRSI